MLGQIDPALAKAYLPELMEDVESPSAARMRTIIEERANAPKDEGAAQMQQQGLELQMQQMQSKIKELESKSMVNAAKAQKLISESSNVSMRANDETMGQDIQEEGEVVA